MFKASRVEQKDGLAHGDFQSMVEGDLKFAANTARQFMRIATWSTQNVVNDHVLAKLPPDYNTIEEVLAPGKFTRREWAKRINEAWDDARESAVAGFIKTGRELHSAKADLGKHGGWMELVANDLKFDQRTANKFMHIATWVGEIGLNESNLVRRLPPDYNTIYGISQLAVKHEPTFQRLLDDGTICPTLPRNDVAALLSKINRQKKHKSIAAQAASIMVPDNFGPFPLIYADPPWQWGHFGEEGQNEKGLSRTPDQHYPTLTYDEIKRFQINGKPICKLAHKDAALFLWCTSANILLAAQVMPGRVTAAIALTHNYTDTAWFQDAAACANAICFTKGRVRFVDPDGELAAPTQGQAFFYFGGDVERFGSVFREVGFVVLHYRGAAA